MYNSVSFTLVTSSNSIREMSNQCCHSWATYNSFTVTQIQAVTASLVNTPFTLSSHIKGVIPGTAVMVYSHAQE